MLTAENYEKDFLSAMQGRTGYENRRSAVLASLDGVISGLLTAPALGLPADYVVTGLQNIHLGLSRALTRV